MSKVEINHKFLIGPGINAVGCKLEFVDDYGRELSRYLAYASSEQCPLMLNAISLKVALMAVTRPYRKVQNIIYSDRDFGDDEELAQWLSYFTKLEFQDPKCDLYLDKILAHVSKHGNNFDSVYNEELE